MGATAHLVCPTELSAFPGISHRGSLCLRCHVSTVERMRSRTSCPSGERGTSSSSPTDGHAARRERWHWRPLAVSVATLAIAGAVIAVTADGTSEILCHERHQRIAPARLRTAAPSLPVDASASATCEAWPATKHRIDAVSTLPAGWYWNTPTRRSDIAQLNAAVSHDLNFLGSQIAVTDPAPVATAARAYISVKRTELIALAARTLDNALASDVTSARSDLNRACGIPNKGGAAA
jgi:hypothetical protein